MKFHVNPKTGDVNRCTATQKCPFGGEEIHFSTATEAREFSEALMKVSYEESKKMTQGKLIVYVGVPGSGKSTLAAAKAEELGGRILNRDTLRTELFGEKYHGKPDGKSEAQVSAILNNRLISTLRKGGVAVDDNTNTNPRFLQKLIQKAMDLGASVEVISVNTSVEEAKRRNAKRGASGGRLVPEFVIDQMASKLYSADGNIKDVLFSYDKVNMVDKITPGSLLIDAYSAEQAERYPVLSRDVVMVDIDGTLSFNHEFLKQYVTGVNVKKDWPGFFEASANAPVNQSVLELTKKIRAGGVTLMALTGRQDDSAQHTIDFLRSAGAPISRLFMARQGDFRGDFATKTTATERLEAEGFRIVHSIDDRPSSIRVWEERGILVSRVPEPLDDATEPPTVNSFVGEGFCLVCGLEIAENSIIHDSCRS